MIINYFLSMFTIIFSGLAYSEGSSFERVTLSPESEYLPIKIGHAKYPSKAISKRIQGYCVVTFAVNTKGIPIEIKTEDCSHKFFVKPSIKATKKLRYPKIELEGKPVEIGGIKHRFTFNIAN